MPRTARRWEPGAIYHVDARAHGGEPIFAMDEDRAFVVERAARVFEEEGVACFAWAVLINHYHLLVRFAGPPGRVMLRLNTAIARRVRLRRGGAGAVFQGPFFAVMCTDEAAVLTRLAYVTANPVHHHVVPSVALLESYVWSSLGEVTGRRASKLAHPASALALVHDRPDLAIAGLIELLEIRVRMWEERDAAREQARHPDVDDPPEPAIPLPRRLGDSVGAPQSLGAIAGGPVPATLDWESVYARRAILELSGWTPDDLIGPACALTGADPDELRAGDRRLRESRARAIVAHVACDVVKWATVDVASAVGVSSSAIVQARRRGAAYLRAAGVDAEELLRRSASSR